MRRLCSFAFVLLSATSCLTLTCVAQQPTFHNPLLPTGPDPWIIADHGFYFYMNSTGSNLTLWKTRDITDLAHAEKKIIWNAPKEGPYSHDIWAPELHRFDSKWYIYFAADAGHNESHRIFVLENPNPDPLSRNWTMKGQLNTVKWAIDATAFEDHGFGRKAWATCPLTENGVLRIVDISAIPIRRERRQPSPS